MKAEAAAQAGIELQSQPQTAKVKIL